MNPLLRIVCVCLICLAVTACGGSGADSNRQAITHLFTSMDAAMARGDYAAACQGFSRRQQANVVSAAKQAGLHASDCAGAFSALLNYAHVSKTQLARAFGGGQAPKIHSLVVHGNQATVAYTATANGKTFTETDGLVREDGVWKADRTISRRNGG